MEMRPALIPWKAPFKMETFGLTLQLPYLELSSSEAGGSIMRGNLEKPGRSGTVSEGNYVVDTTWHEI
jgi:hypothetical protein